ncbi:MAG: Methyltransferase FkbM protein [Actinobacteria bacterium]|nr:Methyltransferase FkbM protein [Actinomycetota bacterium]
MSMTGREGKMPESSNAWIEGFKSDVYSQCGEDGVIGKILEILPRKDRWCVEFGAWDGRHLSNTRNLIENHGYSAVLIEGSKEKFQDLKRNYSKFPNVTALNRFVGFREGDNLDDILKETSIPVDFDFLSIDIDGNDYHVWKAISLYAPKMVCIEFNPTIPTEVRFVQPSDPSVSQGASLSALAELGKSKGYELVSVLPINAFFVRKEFFPLFRIDGNRPELLRKNLENITYLFFGYDGTVFLRGNPKSPWHDMELLESKVQILPKFLRIYPDNYGIVKNFLYRRIRRFRKWIR